MDGTAMDSTAMDSAAEDSTVEEGMAELSKKAGRYGGITWRSQDS